MATLKSLALLLVLIVTFTLAQEDNPDNVLTEPESVSSENGLLDTSLVLALTTTSTDDFFITSRTLNGTIPGPTLKLKPGDTLKIHFFNNLVDQGVPYEENELSAPDESNLHFHGLHVSGELPSDDTTHVVLPGESYQYMTTLPETHMPGTHWLHPHRHGSTTLQVGGGAASAIIVQDLPGTLPLQVEQAKEILLFIQLMELDELNDVAQESGDALLQTSSSIGNEFLLINGQFMPILPIRPGEWVRLRLAYAGWRPGILDLEVAGCEMQLLAKDGVYIRDFPRAIPQARLFPASRADVMVRCMEPSTVYDILGDGTVIATVSTSEGPVVESTSLEPWTPTYPPYLQDLRDTPATPGCSCSTNLDDNNVNGMPFDPNDRFHESYLGAVVERDIGAGNHPYHQHVYPYQLIDGWGGDAPYILHGDWHDVIQGGGIVRHVPTDFFGKVMIHCHRLQHEDQGMMAIEQVHAFNETGNNTCLCSAAVKMNKSFLVLWTSVVGGLLLSWFQ